MILETKIVLQLAIGMVLLLASAGKWRHPLRFAQGVVEYEILPTGPAYWFGLLLIPLESWLAVAHLTGWLLRFAAPTALGMFVVFGLAVGVNLVRGRALPCFCFGARETQVISGWGDTRIYGLFSVLNSEDLNLVITAGLSLPTGVAPGSWVAKTRWP